MIQKWNVIEFLAIMTLCSENIKSKQMIWKQAEMNAYIQKEIITKFQYIFTRTIILSPLVRWILCALYKKSTRINQSLDNLPNKKEIEPKRNLSIPYHSSLRPTRLPSFFEFVTLRNPAESSPSGVTDVSRRNISPITPFQCVPVTWLSALLFVTLKYFPEYANRPVACRKKDVPYISE